MKKLFAILLALTMVLSLAACGGSKDSDKGGSAPANSAVEKYVEENKSVLISDMEQSFATSSGMTCKSSVKVVGNGFVITLKLDGVDGIDSSAKKQMQDAYDQMSSIFDMALAEFQKDCPEIEYYQVDVCEEDGDKLATIRSGK